MGNDVNIKSSGKRIDGTKAEEQSGRLKDIQDKKSADRDAAKKAGRARDEAAAEAQRIEKQEQAEAEAARAEEQARIEEQREKIEALGKAALTAGGAMAGSAVEKAKKGQLKISPKALVAIVVVLAAIVAALALAWPRISATLSPAPETHTAVELSESAVMGNVSAEIGDAILGEARQKQELVVWEQDVQVDSEISQALANIAVFAKTKSVRSFGTGVYTVDMGQIDENAIAVDEPARTVTLRIPHAQLQYITKDLEKTQFEDTQHALLGFGDIKLTQEQQNVLERSIEDAMRAELESSACFADADEAALLVVYDVYQPLVAAIDDAYVLEVEFGD